jgi:hypothetical protein
MVRATHLGYLLSDCVTVPSAATDSVCTTGTLPVSQLFNYQGVSVTLSVNAGDRAAVAALLADVPAFASPSWLPEGVGWPELDERAATHRRLLAARREVVAEATALSEQYRREDAAYQEAMTSGFLADDAGKLPTVTPREDREEARRDLRDRALALDSALARFVTETVAAVEEHAAE